MTFRTEIATVCPDIICPYCQTNLDIESTWLTLEQWEEGGYCYKCNNKIIVRKVTEVKYYVQKDESLSSDET